MPGVSTATRPGDQVMGKKKADGGLPKQVNFRVSDSFYSRIEAAAEALGLDVANLLRMIVKENLATYEQRAEAIRQSQPKGKG
jgi:hypothetical protein